MGGERSRRPTAPAARRVVRWRCRCSSTPMLGGAGRRGVHVDAHGDRRRRHRHGSPAVADAQPGLTVTRRIIRRSGRRRAARAVSAPTICSSSAPAATTECPRIVLGSTTRHVVRDSPCPVAVVRGAAGRGRPDRIVVGVDGSLASDQAVAWAGDEADRHQVGLVIVHGWTYAYAPDDARSVQARELTEIDAACTLERARRGGPGPLRDRGHRLPRREQRRLGSPGDHLRR